MIGSRLALFTSAALAVALPSPQILTDTCPAAPGDLLSIANHVYQVHCDTSFDGKTIGGWTLQPSYANCAARCSNTPNCAAASYSTTTKQCEIYSALIGSKTVLDTHTFLRADLVPAVKRENDVDNSHFPEARQNTACPAKTGQTLSIDGTWYTVQCDTEYPGKTIGGATTQTEFAGCAARCSLTTGCKVAQYNMLDQHCVLYSSTGVPKDKLYSLALSLVPVAQEVKSATGTDELEAR